MKPSRKILGIRLRNFDSGISKEMNWVGAILDYLDEQAQETKASEEKKELLCEECGREYTVWYTSNELWNKATGTDGKNNGETQFLCMDCFAILAEEKGVENPIWEVRIGTPFTAKPQDEPKECCEKCRQYLNKNMNRYECNRYFACPCHQKETEPKEECRFVRYCNQADHNCLSKIDGKYTILPRPKGWRIGQTIWNFKEWLRLTHEVKDFFYMTDDEWNRRWNEYLTSIKSQE